MQTEEKFLTELIEKYRKQMKLVLGDNQHAMQLGSVGWTEYITLGNMVDDLESRLTKTKESERTK